MATLEIIPSVHIVLIEITIGGGRSSEFKKIKSELSFYMHNIKEGRFRESINANVPSGMIGRFSNVHQWIRCKTTRELAFIRNVCNNLSSKYHAKLLLYKWDDEYLTKSNGGIWINLEDPI